MVNMCLRITVNCTKPKIQSDLYDTHIANEISILHSKHIIILTDETLHLQGAVIYVSVEEVVCMSRESKGCLVIKQLMHLLANYFQENCDKELLYSCCCTNSCIYLNVQ